MCNGQRTYPAVEKLMKIGGVASFNKPTNPPICTCIPEGPKICRAILWGFYFRVWAPCPHHRYLPKAAWLAEAAPKSRRGVHLLYPGCSPVGMFTDRIPQ